MTRWIIRDTLCHHHDNNFASVFVVATAQWPTLCDDHDDGEWWTTKRRESSSVIIIMIMTTTYKSPHHLMSAREYLAHCCNTFLCHLVRQLTSAHWGDSSLQKQQTTYSSSCVCPHRTSPLANKSSSGHNQNPLSLKDIPLANHHNQNPPLSQRWTSSARVARYYHVAWTPAEQPSTILLMGGRGDDVEKTVESVPG